MRRTDERNEFLTDVLIGAVENYGYGWFYVDEYEPEGERPGDAYAVIRPFDDAATAYRVTLDTIAHGIGVIRNAELREFVRPTATETALANGKTGERLYLSPESRRQILECDRENDASEIDVVFALAILECGLFGAVTYA